MVEQENNQKPATSVLSCYILGVNSFTSIRSESDCTTHIFKIIFILKPDSSCKKTISESTIHLYFNPG